VALWERCSWALYDGKQAEYDRLRELYEAHFEQPAPQVTP
jgi:hypothetical protein